MMAIRSGNILELKGLYEGKICVAVIGNINDFAVYSQSSVYQNTAVLVARRGDKLFEAEARLLFPELAGYRYRS